MNGLLIIVLGLLGLGLVIFGIRYQRSQRFGQMLDMVFLRVLLPRKDSDSDEKRETSRDFKEQVSLMEQLLVALRSISESGFFSRIFG